MNPTIPSNPTPIASALKGTYSVILIRTSAGTPKLAARRPLFHAGSIACSSALLFVVQPMLAKSLLPRFGGSAGVWIACMLFFQLVLLLGYLYAFCLTRYLAPRTQVLVHVLLMTLSLAALPLQPHVEAPGANPVSAI